MFGFIITIIIIIAVFVTLYLLSLFKVKIPDQSAFDSPQPTLMKESKDISKQHEDVLKKVLEFYDIISNMGVFASVAKRRKAMEDLFIQEVDATITPVDVSGIPSEWVIAKGASTHRRLLYLHGGGFNSGSSGSHRYITAELSKRTGVSVLAINYRLMPR